MNAIPEAGWDRSAGLRGSVPFGIVVFVRFSQAVAEVPSVVLGLNVMHLEPDARNVDRVAMSGEAAMGVIDIGADVLDAVDHVRAVDRRFL